MIVKKLKLDKTCEINECHKFLHFTFNIEITSFSHPKLPANL